jgi:hypothetical protein
VFILLWIHCLDDFSSHPNEHKTQNSIIFCGCARRYLLVFVLRKSAACRRVHDGHRFGPNRALAHLNRKNNSTPTFHQKDNGALFILHGGKRHLIRVVSHSKERKTTSDDFFRATPGLFQRVIPKEVVLFLDKITDCLLLQITRWHAWSSQLGRYDNGSLG